jgi:PAS domain-containing protein
MPMTRDARPVLRLVPAPVQVDWAWFCGHCAVRPPGGEPPAPNARVCPACGLGLLLESRADVAPRACEAFLVVDAALRVQAVSRRAEILLGIDESSAIDQPVAGLLVPADTEQSGPARFAAAIASAIPSEDRVEAFVRPWNTFGVRMRVRIAACGPPRAALLVLEASPPTLRSA